MVGMARGRWLSLLLVTAVCPSTGFHGIRRGPGGRVVEAPGRLMVARRASAVPGSVSAWREYQRNMKEQVQDLCSRVDQGIQTPERPPAAPPAALVLHSFKDIYHELESDNQGTACAALVHSLQRFHFAILRLPEDCSPFPALWDSAAAFFREAEDAKLRIAGPVRAGAASNPSLIVGYQTMDGNEFLETRLSRDGRLHPEGLRDQYPGLEEALVATRQRLTSVGQLCLSVMAQEWGTPAERILPLMDDGSEVPEDSLSTSVHRVCHYWHSTKQAPNGKSKKQRRQGIAFGAHTDATFFTMVPAARTPGLEIFTQETGWVCPELGCEPGRDVVVMPGEFIQIFSQGCFKCSVHRVLRPGESQLLGTGGVDVESVSSRLSAPLLMRGNEAREAFACLAGQNGAEEEGSQRGNGPAVPFPIPPGITMADVHKRLLGEVLKGLQSFSTTGPGKGA